MRQLYKLSVALAVMAAISCSKKSDPAPQQPTNPTGPTTTPLALTDFTPKSAAIGEIVTITGTSFGTDSNAVTIKMGSSAARKPKSIMDGQMTVLIPGDATTGKIQITKGNSTVTSSIDLTVTQSAAKLTITGFSPKTVTTGDTLKITGTNFGTDINKISVLLNTSGGNLGIKPILVTATEVDVVVPSTASTGKVAVLVQGIGTGTSTDNFTFMPQTSVSSLTPTSARAGEIISINGNFPAGTALTSVSVRFTGSGQDVNPLSIDTHSNILVRVPSDAKSGKVKVAKTGEAPGTTFNSLTVLPPLPAVASGTWTQRPDLPSDLFSSRTGAIAFAIGNVGYVGCGGSGGPLSGIVPRNDMWQYDQTYEAWMQVADFAGGNRQNAAAFTIGNKGYVGTGIDDSGKYQNDFWEYDPQKNTWTRKADFSGSARSLAASFATLSNGYIGSGKSASQVYSDFYKYDPNGNSWSQIVSIPGVRSAAYAFAISNQGYVGGGQDATSKNITDFYLYDPSSNSWTAKAQITGYDFTSNNASFVLNGKAYVGLGWKFGSGVWFGTTQVYEYSPQSNSWKAIAPFGGTQRYSAVGFAINNIGYFGTGQADGSTYTFYRDFWAYKQ